MNEIVKKKNEEIFNFLNQNGKYEVIFVDEYENYYLIGFFKDLKEAQEEINEYLKEYNLDKDFYDLNESFIAEFGEGTILGELKEYPSTLGYCFDASVYVDGGNVLGIRGFIF